MDQRLKQAVSPHQISDIISLMRKSVHISQTISGCQWDETTGDIFGLWRYGYDGEDLVAFDFKTSTWVRMRPEAFMFKLKLDTDIDSKQHHNFHTLVCPGWLKNYLSYGKNILQRKVSLLQKSSSSPVSCFATGFYPNKAVLFWRKDGDDLHDNVEEGEILPNPDGTFQKSSDLDFSSVRPEDWGKYECVFQLSGLNDDIITKLDQSGIRSNSGKTETRSDGVCV
uniref:Ig-like domain-containing protein n=1 Tax=Echeneis naucrates TaxID=173247 RepID=A0A665U4I7_ECHNA